LHIIIVITSLQVCNWTMTDSETMFKLPTPAFTQLSWQTTTPLTNRCCDHCMIQVRPLYARSWCFSSSRSLITWWYVYLLLQYAPYAIIYKIWIRRIWWTKVKVMWN